MIGRRFGLGAGTGGGRRRRGCGIRRRTRRRRRELKKLGEESKNRLEDCKAQLDGPSDSIMLQS